MYVDFTGNRGKNEHSITFQWKRWENTQITVNSLVTYAGAWNLRETCSQRKQSINCHVFMEEGRTGETLKMSNSGENSQTIESWLLFYFGPQGPQVDCWLVWLWLGFGFGFGFGFFSWFCSLALLYSIFFPLSLAHWLRTKKYSCLKWTCNEMCFQVFSVNWLTLAKQLSRRLSKSSVTLPPYCTSPIMYRTVLHDTPFIKNKKDYSLSIQTNNSKYFRSFPGGKVSERKH